MQVFINLITRAFFMSTPLILGALGEVLAERTGMMVTAVEGIFLIGAWGGFIGAYLSGSMLAGFSSCYDLWSSCGGFIWSDYCVYASASDRYGNSHRHFDHRVLYLLLSCDFWHSDSTS